MEVKNKWNWVKVSFYLRSLRENCGKTSWHASFTQNTFPQCWEANWVQNTTFQSINVKLEWLMLLSTVDTTGGTAVFVLRVHYNEMSQMCMPETFSKLNSIANLIYVRFSNTFNISRDQPHESRDCLTRNLTFFWSIHLGKYLWFNYKSLVETLLDSLGTNPKVIKTFQLRLVIVWSFPSFKSLTRSRCLIIPPWCTRLVSYGNNEDEACNFLSSAFVHCFSFSFNSNYSFKCLHFSLNCIVQQQLQWKFSSLSFSICTFISRFDFCLRSRHASQFSLSKCFEILAI